MMNLINENVIATKDSKAAASKLVNQASHENHLADVGKDGQRREVGL
jgi:hypothetical protein